LGRDDRVPAVVVVAFFDWRAARAGREFAASRGIETSVFKKG
jgi:hypothetical protein